MKLRCWKSTNSLAMYAMEMNNTSGEQYSTKKNQVLPTQPVGMEPHSPIITGFQSLGCQTQLAQSEIQCWDKQPSKVGTRIPSKKLQMWTAIHTEQVIQPR